MTDISVLDMELNNFTNIMYENMKKYLLANSNKINEEEYNEILEMIKLSKNALYKKSCNKIPKKLY